MAGHDPDRIQTWTIACEARKQLNRTTDRVIGYETIKGMSDEDDGRVID